MKTACVVAMFLAILVAGCRSAGACPANGDVRSLAATNPWVATHSVGTQFFGQCFAFFSLTVEVGDYDLYPPCCEQTSCSFTDARGTAGHNCRSSIEFHKPATLFATLRCAKPRGSVAAC